MVPQFVLQHMLQLGPSMGLSRNDDPIILTAIQGAEGCVAPVNAAAAPIVSCRDDNIFIITASQGAQCASWHNRMWNAHGLVS